MPSSPCTGSASLPSVACFPALHSLHFDVARVPGAQNLRGNVWWRSAMPEHQGAMRPLPTLQSLRPLRP